MKDLILDSENTTDDKPKCKGIYWRGSVNVYVAENGRISQKNELRILKKMSCPGCSDCGWIIDFLREDLYSHETEDLLSHIEHGKIYTTRYTTSTDWESQISEVDSIGFVEVKE